VLSRIFEGMVLRAKAKGVDFGARDGSSIS